MSVGDFREYLAIVEGRHRLVRIEREGDDLRIRVGEEEFHVGITEDGLGELCVSMNGRPQVVNVRVDEKGRYRVMLGGGETTVEITDPVAARVSGSGSGIQAVKRIEVRAPMHGLVVAVQVSEGDEVEEEAPLVVLEAMKMQNALTSPAAGIVRQVLARAGESVEGDALLVVLDRKDAHEPEA